MSYLACEGCPYRDEDRHVPGRLLGGCDLMIVGEGPGEEEIKRGVPFVGPSGRLLRTTLEQAGVTSSVGVSITNATLCRPPLGAKISNQMIQACRGRLLAEIHAENPRVLLALGNSAVQGITGAPCKITQIHGTSFPLNGAESPTVVACLHPAAILRNGSDYGRFRQAVIYAAQLVRGEVARNPGETKFIVARESNIDQIIDKLHSLPWGSLIGCDIETTGLNPRQDQVVALGISWEVNRVFIIPANLIPKLAEAHVFRSIKLKFVWHNGKFDTAFLRQMGINVFMDEDTLLIHYCLVPGTKVLKRDLTWSNIEELDSGDEIIGFDEDDTSVMLPSVVTKTRRLVADCYKIITDKGEVTASANHSWLARKYGQPVRRWETTKDLHEYLKKGCKAELTFFVEPWETDRSYNGGYIAGILDGEGCLCFVNSSKGQKTEACSISFAQKPGTVLNKVLSHLQSRGISVWSYTRSGGVVKNDLRSKDSLKALGMFRPPRLLEKSDRMWMGRRKGLRAEVLSIEFVGEREVVGIETTTKTLIANGFMSHNCLNETKGTHDLKQLAGECLGAPDYEKGIKPFLKTGWKGCSTQLLCEYLARDCDYTLQLYHYLKPQLAEVDGLEDLYKRVLLAASDLLQEVERNGIWANPEYINEVREVLLPRLRGAYNRLQAAKDLLGMDLPDINPNSPKQVSALLYEHMKLKVPQGYAQNTREETLRVLPTNPVTESILEYREVAKLIGTYVEGIANRIDPTTQRVHSTYLIHGTVTGRLSSRNPNNQNVPRDPLIKGIYQAPEGKWLLELDLDQAELRVLANLSQDPELIAIYQAGRKLHHEVATEMYGENYTPEQYIRAKAINFGIMYGRGPTSLVQEFGGPNITRENRLTVLDAKRLVSVWFKRFPVAYEFIQKCRSAPGRGIVLRSPTGRRRRFGLVTENNKHELENEAANFPIQSTASDINLLSAYRVMPSTEGWGVKIVNLIHDSTLFEVPQDEVVVKEVASYMADIIKEVGEELLGDSVAMECEAKLGQKWGSLQKMKWQ